MQCSVWSGSSNSKSWTRPHTSPPVSLRSPSFTSHLWRSMTTSTSHQYDPRNRRTLPPQRPNERRGGPKRRPEALRLRRLYKRAVSKKKTIQHGALSVKSGMPTTGTVGRGESLPGTVAETKSRVGCHSSRKQAWTTADFYCSTSSRVTQLRFQLFAK